MNKRKLLRADLWAIMAIILFSAAAFTVIQVFAPNLYAANISGRLKQRGVPVKHVTTISRIPYVIEIALQSSSDDDHLVIEDNWFMQLAEREATLAYRIGKRLNSYKLTVYNTVGKLIYSMQAYLHPEDLNQQLDLSESPKISDLRAKEIVAGELQLAGLHLDKLDVLPENAMGSNGQILLIQASAKDVEAANQFLPDFLDSLFYTLETVNAEHGAYIVLCHFQLLDSQGKVLMDYVRDLESGSTRWKSVQGLYNGWFPQPVVLETALPLPTSATPSIDYPAPDSEAPNPTLPEGHSGPPLGFWQVADQQPLKEGDISIAIYGIHIAEYETMLIYSAAGSAVDELTKPDTIVQLRDDQDRISELVSTDTAATIKNLRLGVMRFKPRQIGANELFLHVRRASDSTDLVDMVVAWFKDPPEDPKRKGASYLVPTTQVFEQAGYRITFMVWRPPPQNIESITPTPFSLLEHASLQIEEIEGNRVYQLHIRILANGEITSELNEYVKLPTQTPP